MHHQAGLVLPAGRCRYDADPARRRARRGVLRGNARPAPGGQRHHRANDPAWLEEYRGRPPADRYWQRIARGGLDQLRTHRREILTPYCEGPASQRYQLTDRDLVVTGSLASYRIDLATANVRTEPADKWLSFDTRPAPPAPYPSGIPGLLALDDDEILQRVLIRAAILADDEQLASRKLLKQIRG